MPYNSIFDSNWMQNAEKEEVKFLPLFVFDLEPKFLQIAYNLGGDLPMEINRVKWNRFADLPGFGVIFNKSPVTVVIFYIVPTHCSINYGSFSTRSLAQGQILLLLLPIFFLCARNKKRWKKFALILVLYG